MTTFIFYREDNKFDDILSDTNIKKHFKQKISFRYYLIIMGHHIPDETKSYMMLKYGDEMRTWDHIRKDNSPVPYKDYIPDPKRPEKFRNVYK